jgi:CheY-like chemotaxis protein
MYSKSLNVLIADDDSDDQSLIQEAFRNCFAGTNLHSVYNGRELLDYLTKKAEINTLTFAIPDVIILDLNMPIMDGVSALKKIKGIESLKEIPVYILTTSKNDFDRMICKQLGAVDFYTKPSDFSGLQETIKQIFLKTAG